MAIEYTYPDPKIESVAAWRRCGESPHREAQAGRTKHPRTARSGRLERARRRDLGRTARTRSPFQSKLGSRGGKRLSPSQTTPRRHSKFPPPHRRRRSQPTLSGKGE